MSMISGSSGFKNSITQNRALPDSGSKVAPEKQAPKPVDTAVLSPDKAELTKSNSSKAGEVTASTKAAAPDPTAGAEEVPGLFKLLKKDDKVWFSIGKEQLNKPFFFSANVSKSIGEKRLVGSELGSSQLAEFRKVGNQVQLVAKHTDNFAEAGTPQERFVKEGFSDSIIASAPLTPGSRPDGEVLVEANALLFTDIAGYQQRLAKTYGTAFALDVKNTSFTGVDNADDHTSFGVQTHYQAPAILTPTGSLPSTTPEGRSALVEFRFNFLKLPEEPMKPRLADDRIGHFVTTRKDYTGDEGDGLVRYVNRWRLEKQDPSAEISDPVKPITYWIANDVPEEYRDSVKDGILEWNKAFERIGFNNAIEVKQQPADATFDTLDAAHASVRWYTAADVGSAVGPSHVDPRSGEILDADIRMADVFGRSAKRVLMDNPSATVAHEAVHDHGHDHSAHSHAGHTCEFAAHAAYEHEFAANLLNARGDHEASEKLAKAYVKDVVMHEVGHTLGLRHNFRGSTVYSPEQLQDAEFTKANGLGSSVMDYQPFNLAAAGEKQGEMVQSTLGAYDYLAIQYAYAPLEAEQESTTLNEIAKKTTTDPLYAYESDEAADASDPGVNRFDLGNDPLQFAEKQMQLGRELWERAQTRELPEDASYTELTRAFSSGLNNFSKSARLAARYIGGATVRRDRAGTGNAVHEPVPAEKQREALNLLMDSMFQPDSFRFKPEFVSRLAKDRFETWGDQNIHVGQSVLRTQASTIGMLLAPDVAQRLIDNPEKVSEDTPSLPLSEVYETLQNNIWSELGKGTEISQARRDLQREYLKAVGPLLSPTSKHPGEVGSVMRFLASELKDQVDQAASSSTGKSLEYRAHLKQVSQTLASALGPEG